MLSSVLSSGSESNGEGRCTSEEKELKHSVLDLYRQGAEENKVMPVWATEQRGFNVAWRPGGVALMHERRGRRRGESGLAWHESKRRAHAQGRVSQLLASGLSPWRRSLEGGPSRSVRVEKKIDLVF